MFGPGRTYIMNIIVLGYIVRGPLGGLAWHHLQYVAGLQRLGHCVTFLEDSDEYTSCFDPVRNVMDIDPSCGLAFTQRVFERLGLGSDWAYYDQHKQRWHGPLGAAARKVCGGADLLLDLSGVNPIRSWLEPIPVRVLIDTDPVFTQVRHLLSDWSLGRARKHNVFFSFGENLADRAASGCTGPDDGFCWQATRQPVVADLWPVQPPELPPREACWTTVMQWDSYKSETFQGREFGMKSLSFKPYLELPRRLPAGTFELAMPVNESAALLRERGWRVVEAQAAAADPWAYQAYLRRSRGEFSIAKQGYVSTRCGWFSERSCAYLASGRPVVVQDTGLERLYPLGRGVLTFRDPDEAEQAVRRVNEDYAAQCAAARAFVEEQFDYRKVLGDLLRAIGV